MEAHLPRRYRIIGPLGHGGQGRVWLVTDRLHGNARVALKVLPWARGSRSDPQGLSREFLLLSRLAHPNIARVRDFGLLLDGSGAYFTSEYVRGGSLFEWVSGLRGEIKWPRMIDVTAQALSVLQYLSFRGLQHGDVKPMNLLVEIDPEAPDARPVLKLIDFGIARIKSTLEQGESHAGTPAYLPPPPALHDAERPDLDLYGLGMSLFHAATGRLPYAIGSPGALEAWWRAGKPTHPRAIDPSVPAALDSLVAGLIDPSGTERFRSAGDALEFVKGRVPLPPRLPPRGADEAWFTGREAFVENLVEGLTKPSGGSRIHVIAAPPGSGKSRVLELLEASLQARGFRTIFFRHARDERGLRQARELTAEMEGGRRSRRAEPPHDDQMLGALLGLESAVLLDDDAAPGEPSEFFHALGRALSEGRRVGRRPLFVAAAVSPESLAATLGIERARIAVHPLEPLDAPSVAAAIREFFAVEEAPQELVTLVHRATQGVPRLVREALERLVKHGASSDFLGQIRVPRPLPEQLVPSGTARPAHKDLEPPLRRALGLFLLAGQPLGPAAAAALFPEAGAGGWRERLEALRWRGWVKREDREPEELFHATGVCGGTDLASLLDPDLEASRMALRSSHIERLRSCLRPALDFLLAAAANFLALGEGARAARCALRARHRLSPAEVDQDFATLLVRILGAPEESVEGRLGWNSSRGRAVVRLRAAQALLQLGQIRDALQLLDPPARGSPAWQRRATLWLVALLHEQAGNAPCAIDALQQLREEASAAASRQVDRSRATLWFFEATSRLAPLYFLAGRPAQGQACLSDGRALLQEDERSSSEQSAGAFCRILARFSSAEASHGEPEVALRLLEKACRWARASGRDELMLGPLNELGILYAQRQRSSDALRTFDEIEAIARRQGDRAAALRAVYNRALIHYRLHDLDRAEALFREARRVSESLGLHSLSAAVWLGFAGVLRERRRFLEALRLYRRVLGNPAIARPNDLAVAHNNVSEIYLVLGRPAKALVHADFAFRIARRTRNRFLISLALRSRGRARFTLGRVRDSRRDLEKSIAVASKDGDARARGVANYYLGLVECACGDTPSAFRRLREAMVWSRRAGDSRNHHAAEAALFTELLRLGRTKAVRRILLDGASRQAAAPRDSFAYRLLRERLSAPWPEYTPRILAACREASEKGEVWEAFSILTSALREEALPVETRHALLLERDAILSSLLRRIPRRHAALFRSFWAPTLRSSETVEPLPARDAKPDSLPPDLERLSGGGDILAILLEGLREALGARRAWLLLDPVLDSKACVSSGQEGLPLEAVLEARARATGTSGASSGVAEAPPFLFLQLPHDRAVRSLCIEGPAPSLGYAGARGRLLEGAVSVVLALRLQEQEALLSRERERLEVSRDEVRRLNSLTMHDRQELETAFLTQGLAALDLRRELEARSDTRIPRRVLAASASMRSILDRLPRIAAHEIPVLLIGESGVGKDLLARRIHDLSPRRSRPYVAEVCNIAESLMEAELFGFVEGAFTGAVAGRPGVFERVNGGTIYLDEISGLPQALQARLLRVLDEKEVRPIGAARAIAVDFRLLSSSSLILEEIRQASTLRKDLFYRIHAEVIEIPPLRHRQEDIPLLVAEFLARHAQISGQRVPYVHAKAMERLVEHRWPGNVRELENELQRTLIERPVEITAEMLFTPPSQIRPGLHASSRSEALRVPPFKEERRRVERNLLLRALEIHGGNATSAARSLRITRRYLGRLMEKHGIRLNEVKTGARVDEAGPGTGGEAAGHHPRKKGSLRNRRPGTHG